MNNLLSFTCVDEIAEATLKVNVNYAFLAIQVLFILFALFVWLKNYKKWKPKERITYQLLALGVIIGCYGVLFYFLKMRFVVCYM